MWALTTLNKESEKVISKHSFLQTGSWLQPLTGSKLNPVPEGAMARAESTTSERKRRITGVSIAEPVREKPVAGSGR